MMRRQVKLGRHNAHKTISEGPFIGILSLVGVVELPGHPIIGGASWARSLVERIVPMASTLSADLHALNL